MPRGTEKIFKVKSGNGFIQPEGVDDGTPDVFIHISTVERAGLSTLKAGQLVECDIAESRGRPVAKNLCLVKARGGMLLSAPNSTNGSLRFVLFLHSTATGGFLSDAPFRVTI
jgi:CspA family cold shock protein